MANFIFYRKINKLKLHMVRAVLFKDSKSERDGLACKETRFMVTEVDHMPVSGTTKIQYSLLKHTIE